MASEDQDQKVTLDPTYDHYDFPVHSATERPGHPGHTTPEQDAQVFQLRSLLEQEGYKDRLDTLTMLRFLRARKFNVEASKKMFIDCENWRQEFKLDDLVVNFDYTEKAQIFQYYPQYYHKTDKDGRPVYIEQLGKIDLAAMYKISTGDRMLKNLIVEYEKMADPRLPACSRKAGHLLETSCTIMDLKGVGLGSASSVYGYLKQASGVSQNYYPERLGKMYIINAPWGFSTIFSFIKGFLDPVTVEKIHVFGGGYQATLLDQVPAENLPKAFGGTCECADGCELSDAGPWHDPQWAKPAWWQVKKTEQEAKKPEDIATEDAAGSASIPAESGEAATVEGAAPAEAKPADAPAAATDTQKAPVA
ncbi:Sec14 cytosolic factor [Eremomyces bilateralis CBS 781.70]|uniref:Sec14 cytosolic factor n=1 Tax=Eremomyces bilateralis CBS 781.70 TaxID=1392243 RepID=A0A6G1FT34_9PEZI|nr:Sec14 cytosolic factor [Eremomyces bilateralis CBS 781.70]KAF1808923.1 Sec14 cytosolic factor [Eremomyces bilateralis CBS 781.70]